MTKVYTADEVAGFLEISPRVVLELADSGRLSGFQVGDEWRTTQAAFVADLRRAQLPIQAARPLPFASRDAVAPIVVDPTTPHDPESKAPEFRERFRIQVDVDNDSQFSGDFHLRVTAEGDNDAWEGLESEGCEVRDGEVQMTRGLAEDDIGVFFTGTLEASYGDRIFITVPEQKGIDRAAEQVYVLEDHTEVKITLTRSGLLGRKTGVRFSRL